MNQPGVRQRVPAAAPTGGVGASGRAYTPEQETLCKKILQTREYYAVLNVSRTATEDEIKRAYKKMAFQLHPDKNCAPQAEDAFKHVNKVYNCLTDPTKRRYYDQTGQDEDAPQARAQAQYRQANHGHGGMTAEDFFQEFFFGGMGGGGGTRFHFHQRQAPPPRQRQAQQSQRQSQQQQQQQGSYWQFLPVIFFLFIYLWSGFVNFMPDSSRSTLPTFSFNRGGAYNLGRSTRDTNVNYFVNSQEWNRASSGHQKELEKQVEIGYMQNLLLQCEKEHQTRQKESRKATAEKDLEKLRSIASKPLAQCEAAKQLKRQFPHLSKVTLNARGY